MTWKFSDPPNTAVFTSVGVLMQGDPICRVSHDKGDGAWQFHGKSGAPDTIEDSRLVSLQTIVTIDPSVESLANLPIGWTAVRSCVAAKWERQQSIE